jgi:hypothetical protein
MAIAFNGQILLQSAQPTQEYDITPETLFDPAAPNRAEMIITIVTHMRA